MAEGVDLLAALFGSQYKPIETPYGIAASGIASAIPAAVDPYGNNWENFGTVLGGALLSGLLGYQARKQADERNIAQSRAITEMLAGGMTPERRTQLLEEQPRLAKVFGQLDLQKYLSEMEATRLAKAADVEAQRKSMLTKAEDLGVTYEDLRKGNIPTGTASYGTKAENVLDGKRKTFQANPIFDSVAISEETIKRLAPAVFNQQAMTSRDFVVGAVQIIEPGMAVREGDEAAVKAAAGALNLAQNKIKNVFDGEGELSLQDRAQIMDIVERAYNGRLETFNNMLDSSIKDAAKSINRDSEDVIADLKARFAGGLGRESYDQIVNRKGVISGAKLPSGFDFAGAIRGIARREIPADTFFDRIRSEFGQQEQKVAEAVATAPEAVAPERGSALASALAPTPEATAISKRAAPTATPAIAAMQQEQVVSDTEQRKAPEMVAPAAGGSMDAIKARIAELVAKGIANLTRDELIEIRQYQQMAGL